MSGLKLVLTTAGRAAEINPDNTGTNAIRIAWIGVTEQAFTATKELAEVPGEIKRLATFAGATVADDTIHITLRDDSQDTYLMRGLGLYLEDGTLYASYGQDEVILEKAELAMLLLSTDIGFGDMTVTHISFGDSNWINPPATTTIAGVVELATNAEANTGTDTARAMTPAANKAALDYRLGEGAPSTFIKGLLDLTTAALLRTALELGNAARRDEGQGHGLDADLLDGQHGAFYCDWNNFTHVPSAFPPSVHRHLWSDISEVPATAARWPSYNEVSDKPLTFPPAVHTHSAADISSGTLAAARIPTLPITKVDGLQAAIQSKFSLEIARERGIADLSAPTLTNANDISYTSFGAWRANPTSANTPGSSYYQGLQWSFDVNSSTQLAAIAGTTTFRMFGRSKGGGNWGGWIELYHTGNFNPATKFDKSGGAINGAISVLNGTSGGDAVSIGAERLGASNMYGFGNEPNALYSKALGYHRWYIGTNADGGASARMTLSLSGCVATGGFQNGSSRHLKTALRPLPYGLAEIERIQTRVGRYKRSYDPNGRSRLFVIAEQLAKVVPEAVFNDGAQMGDKTFATVEYSQLVPVLIRAVQELAARVKHLEAGY